MAERAKNMRQLLIEAGMEEINRVGATNFSVRRVAENCGVSCAAPYKHFKDRHDFVAAIIEYVNGQWRVQQAEILRACGDDLHAKIVENFVGYLRFLMENPWFRSVLLLKNAEFDNIYHKTRGDTPSPSQRLEIEFYRQSGWDEAKMRRKLHLIRAYLFGTVFMIESGELEYNEELLSNVRMTIEREFDLP